MDVPDLSGTITTTAGSDLQINVSGEASTRNGKRMFMSAMVDGELANPSDVVFAKGGFAGTHAFTFTKKSLTAGPHVVRGEGWVDAGGSAALGDRTLTLEASPEHTDSGGLVVVTAP